MSVPKNDAARKPKVFKPGDSVKVGATGEVVTVVRESDTPGKVWCTKDGKNEHEYFIAALREFEPGRPFMTNPNP
jgi:hypothetical protein